MRFKEEFAFLPAGFPKDLYTEVKAVVVKRPVELNMRPDTRKVLQALAKELPPGFFCDSNIFPLDPGVAYRLSKLEIPDVAVRRWYGGDFQIHQDGKNLVLKRLVGSEPRVVIAGSSFDVFEYVIKFAVSALPVFVEASRRGLVVTPPRLVPFVDNIKSYRVFRNHSKGLNRISKVEQLARVDQDSTLKKFPLASYWNGAGTVWHLGSGREWATSQRALWMYRRVVCVDPLLAFSNEDHLKKTWQQVKDIIPDEDDVVSDVSFGDGLGMIRDGMLELVGWMQTLVRENRVVVVKLNIEVDYVGLYGEVVSKVRPHNSEVVVRLGGDELVDLAGLREQVLQANDVRNMRVLTHLFPEDVKEVDVTSDELSALMRRPGPYLAGLPHTVVRRPGRVQMYCEAVGIQAMAERHKKWIRCCKTRQLPDVEFVVLPNAFQLQPGPVVGYDPGLADVRVGLVSVLRTAEMAGLTTRFDGFEWVLC